jgi:small subunit ribosomal protein S7
MALILQHLRTAPPPKLNPARPLMPGHPPAAQLPLDPATYLTVVVDSVAPLIRVEYWTGYMGGGQSMPMPLPLKERMRRRAAWQWILDAVAKKPSRGSGRKQFADRVAQEIIAIAEGRSTVWQRRNDLHKLGTASRANVGRKKLLKNSLAKK